MAQTEMSVNLSTSSTNIPTETPTRDFCTCDFDCEYTNLVFAGSNSYESDRSDFLVEIPDTLSGSFLIKLRNINTDNEVPLTDNTYGTYFALGSFPTQPLKGGYLIEWDKVRDAIGFGVYKVLIEQNFFGQTINTETNKFQLVPFSERLANKTVRIEAIQNGAIEGGIDYTGMNWLKSVRIPGKFGFKTPRLERDSYENTSREVTQIQDKVINEYRLETRMLPANIFDPLLEDGFMSNQIFITDYNVRSYNDIRQLSVVPINYSESNTYYNSTKGRYIIEFEERTQDKIKRN